MSERARLIFFVVGVVALNLGPLVTLLGRPVPPNWRMYHGYKEEMCAVRVFVDDELVDRYALLGHDNPRSAPKYVRRIADEAQARLLAAKLCDVMSKREAELRVELRCGHKRGWKESAFTKRCVRRGRM